MSKKARKKQKAERPPEASVWRAIAQWLEKHPVLICGCLVAIASLRIISTYTFFNHTIDEPAHIACGMEWLDKQVYRYETQHPPLARVASAIGPYLAGRRMTDKAMGPTGTLERPSMYQQGALILYLDNHYDRNLALARLGILPFFWLASIIVFLWTRKYLGTLTATIALFLFSFLPPVLAHAGLATTDMALTAWVGASFFAALLWIERPSPARAFFFGVSTGLAVLSKFSSLLFLPAAFAAALIWYWTVPSKRAAGALMTRALTFGLAVLTGALVIWAGYRFSFAKIPAPELFDGIHAVILHNRHGHPAYLLGTRSNTGFWYYYPVILMVKTPLPFLALLAVGCILAIRKAGRANAALWLPLAFSSGILVCALFSRVNIGVRHILPVYTGFSIVAAAGAVWLWKQRSQTRWAGWTLLLLLGWHAATSLASHPDYIPYTNALAGSEPEKILVDSDLDWGQDMKRLAQRLRDVGAREVTFNPLILGYLEAFHGFPPIRPMDPIHPAPGWNAASLTVMKIARLGLEDEHPEIRLWTDRIPPTEKVGKTTYLWYFPPGR